jgi:N-acetylglutamate synthase-like GNAT family acetyltransferase
MLGIHTKIEKVNHNVIQKLSNKAKKDKVNLKDTETTQWFAIYGNDVLLGCAGTILKNGKGRIRGVFVLPEYRKLGLGSKLMQFIIDDLSNNNACYIDQLSSQPNWWLKNGWKTKSVVKNGSWIYKII